MENDKAWERRSDEWIKSMNESKLRKEQRLQQKLIDDKTEKYTLKEIDQYPKCDSYTVKKT